MKTVPVPGWNYFGLNWFERLVFRFIWGQIRLMSKIKLSGMEQDKQLK